MKEKKLKFPGTCALLFMIIIVATILTWVIPAGKFDTEKIGKITKVIPGTFHYIDRTPQGPWDIFNAVVLGFYKASKLMTMIMFVGAAVYILEKTKTIELAFTRLTQNRKINDALVVFSIMLFMTVGGAAGVFANPTVALIPIGILLTTAMGLDKAAGFFIVYLGAYSGFNVGWANSSTLAVAHPIAELPIFSGLNVRIIIHIINFIFNFVFVLYYIKSIRKDPTNSLNYEVGMKPEEYMGIKVDADEQKETFGWKHAVSLLATFVAVATILFGATKLKWSNDHFSTVFFILSIFVGLVHGLGLNGTIQMFLKGCASMLNAAFIVGFANGISIILANGNILNTIVYGLSIPMTKLGAVVGANFMFIANLIINLFIPSGSGQAAAVMPILVPVADLAGITRQVAVQAFQFGDGFSNCIYPTAGTLMGSLGIAGIAWNRYAKRFLPLILVQTIFSFVCLTILQMIGWTGL